MSFSVVEGRSTAPASAVGGRPSAPTTATDPSHAVRSACSARVAPCRTSPSTMGNGTWSSPASARASARRSAASAAPGGGSATSSGSSRSPVAASSIRSSRWRAMRKEDGTTAPADPLWTPWSRTSTVRVPTTAPRNEVVTHRRSPVGLPESRATTRSGVPIRSARAARTVGEVWAPALLGALDQHDTPGVPAAGGPDRTPAPPAADGMAYPSSAMPRPKSRSPSTTGVHGPRPAPHPTKGGCLS